MQGRPQSCLTWVARHALQAVKRVLHQLSPPLQALHGTQVAAQQAGSERDSRLAHTCCIDEGAFWDQESASQTQLTDRMASRSWVCSSYEGSPGLGGFMMSACARMDSRVQGRHGRPLKRGRHPKRAWEYAMQERKQSGMASAPCRSGR